jgi:V8-like Glu-specific endopeptidase
MKLRIAFYLVLLVAMVGCATHSPRDDLLSRSRAVALRLEMDGNGVCSGTAIGPHLILSATHCFEDLKELKVNDKVVHV